MKHSQRWWDILRKADGLKKSKGECKNKLNLEEQLLMVLEYLREYPTYFHISQNYGISESSAYIVNYNEVCV
ncbi:DDE superendonuclease family protein [Orientia tsutsugamushi str. Kato PP]|uniref:DDE transposase family protein n=1 Tax=Orientia tsutsugamushi TaxID=784 RepID=A0A2U3R583_ORITS|nr:DDE superendonuclease family protein [Orientia tsutsugamushi str. Kato PP]SPR08373.1 DDE transposase family protein [Orientia tsutsugamushi]